MRRAEYGFSFVEMMLVMAIVAILISIALPSLLGQRTRAMDMEAKSTLSAVGRGQAGLEPNNSGYIDDLATLEDSFPELEFGTADDQIHVVVGDVETGDSGQVLLYARSDSGTWFGLRLVAHGAEVGRHTCSGAETDMTLVACTGTDW